MTTTELSVPEIHCDHCRAAIEGAVAPLEGVEAVEVDVPAALVRIRHADGAMAGVVGAIEDQGYDVPAQPGLGG